MEDKFDHLLKILLIGDAGVGKSSILLRYTDGIFDPKLSSTIGVDFKVKYITVDDKKIKLSLWDTAGQERFRTLTSSYYRNAQGILLVYDVSSETSFESLKAWMEEVEMFSLGKGSGVVKLLVGNKVDMKDRRVSREDGEEWARQNECMFCETSAKTKVGIHQAFAELVTRILETPALLSGVAAKGRKLARQKEEAEDPCC